MDIDDCSSIHSNDYNMELSLSIVKLVFADGRNAHSKITVGVKVRNWENAGYEEEKLKREEKFV